MCFLRGSKQLLRIKVLGGFIIVFLFQPINSQVFEHAENVAGLSVLEQNSGVAVADYNGDNLLDLFVVAISLDAEGIERTHSRLFRNDNDGSFTDVTVESGLTNLLTQDYSQDIYYIFTGPKIGAHWGDYDNDGFPDLFFTNTYNVLLYHNNGDGTFQNVTETAGISVPTTCQFAGATWFDYNNDGLLDIYINEWGHCSSNILYRNNGNGTFTDVTLETNTQEEIPRSSFNSLPFDFNNDGFMDLYVTNDFNEPNYLYINQNGNSFIEQASTYNLDNMIDDMGIAFGDFNNDGFYDIFITGKAEGSLLQNNTNNSFSDVAVAYGVFNSGWGWGPIFADFDLDGDEDLFVSNGYDLGVDGDEYNFYYKNKLIEVGNGFSNLTQDVGLYDSTASLSAVEFDYDNDGDLDIFLSNSDTHSYFYENKLLNYDDAETTLNWFQIILEGTTSNRDAIGTEVELVTSSGTFKRYNSGLGFLGQSLKPLHFGLNQDTEILQIIIRWPSGLVENYYNLTSNTFVKAIEGVGLEPLNISPSIRISGCTDPLSCNFNPDATIDNGSCEYVSQGTLSGLSTAGFLSTQTYSYSGTGNSLHWSVQGGEILNGQGTSQILVHWGFGLLGSVNVVESTASCSSEPVTLDVTLENSGIPQNISVARLWNEALLAAIRKDFARPTVHARNLFHSSVAMYDAWAVYDEVATPYLVGNNVHGFSSNLENFTSTESISNSQNKAISYAMYRLLTHRFQNSPNTVETQLKFDYLMEQLGYDTNITSTDYQSGDPAAFGNYVAQVIIDYGFNDGSRESTGYDNAFYQPVNPALSPAFDNSTIIYPNRWQPLSLETYIDQSGNEIEGDIIPFLSPEWGNVLPFALSEADKTIYQRNGNDYYVYKDPSDPPYLEPSGIGTSSDAYKWAFELVSVWSSHNDPTDGVFWDVSPKSIGGIAIESLPNSYLEHPDFYDLTNGGDSSPGHNTNPYTGQPYEEQWVPRGDYTRVLAEFWADGPDSETPPGHWFTILNYVSDHPLLEKRFNGQGDILPDLEWDVKTYFILGGAMHDAAVTSWGVKGWYDYIRPISAIRYMASLGQSSDITLGNYNPQGIQLMPGFIEVVEEGDPLAGAANQNVGKIKLYSWRGHDFVNDPETDTSGVGWILSEDWWPYQRPSFVTPPFAGYVSGHSTYSRAAAEVMTLITGDDYFPGGIGEFHARQNEFLVFEEGPSVDVTLQWATYRDASDQCSLSRIWGGIHPPSDDIPGRLMGYEIGNEAYDFAVPYFYGTTLETTDIARQFGIYPNPVKSGGTITVFNSNLENTYTLYDLSGRTISVLEASYNAFSNTVELSIPQTTATGIYILSWNGHSKKIIVTN